jgi:hypothetical protein
VNGEEYLNTDEAAAFLEVSESTLYIYKNRGLLHPTKKGGKGGKLNYYRKSELTAVKIGVGLDEPTESKHSS